MADIMISPPGMALTNCARLAPFQATHELKPERGTADETDLEQHGKCRNEQAYNPNAKSIEIAAQAIDGPCDDDQT